ncbi:MAG: hypothetical protein GX289_07655 [Tissierellia bacterium]|nr:hypothetical protein [Tissierellia bacterium]
MKRIFNVKYEWVMSAYKSVEPKPEEITEREKAEEIEEEELLKEED